MIKRLFLFFLISMLISICFMGCARRYRTVSLKYLINILPKEGENPKNVTVYLPFPHFKGKPVAKVFEAMKYEFDRYVKDDHPEAVIKLASTRYGKMMRIDISNLGEGISFGADPLDPEYGPVFNEAVSLPSPSTRYILKPRFEIESMNGHQVSHTVVYVDYEDATGLIFRMEYIVKDRTRGLLPWSHPVGGDFFAFIGSDKLPDPKKRPFTIPLEVEVTEKGWIKLPVAEASYGSR